MLRLTIGTFLKVLNLCAEKPNQRKMIEKITMTIDKDSKYTDSNDSNVSQSVGRVFRCEYDLSESLTNIRELARNVDIKNVILEFERIDTPFIADKKKLPVVLALRDIIEKDATIDMDPNNAFYFEKYLAASKEDLLKQREFVHSAFFSGILLYTLNATKNNEGKECIKKINEKYIEDVLVRHATNLFVYYNEITEDKKKMFQIEAFRTIGEQQQKREKYDIFPNNEKCLELAPIEHIGSQINQSSLSLRHYLPEKPVFFGRKDKFEEIANVFKASKYAVLSGVGSIGKSYVALAYAHGLAEIDSLIVQHITCEDSDSLRDAIANLQFDGWTNYDEELKFEQKINILEACKQPVLIILDNLEQRFSQDDLATFQKVIACSHVQLLITSQSTLVSDKRNVIHIDYLDDESMLELYTYHRFSDPANHKDYIHARRDVLLQMFEFVGKHTLMIELLAKLPIRSGMDEYEISKRVSDALNISSCKISSIKDNKSIENTIKETVKAIFSVFKLDDSEKNAMRHMALIPLCGIELRLFVELTGCDRKIIIRLSDSHWIKIDEETLKVRLHPLIYETILNTSEIWLSKDTCHTFLSNLQKKLDSFEPKSPTWYQYNKIMLSARRGLLFSLVPTNPKYSIHNLKEEYRSALLLLDKIAVKYLTDNESLTIEISNEDED